VTPRVLLTPMGRDKWCRHRAPQSQDRPLSRARGDTTALHGPRQELFGDAGLNSELKAIPIRVENNALIVTVTRSARSLLNREPGRP